MECKRDKRGILMQIMPGRWYVTIVRAANRAWITAVCNSKPLFIFIYPPLLVLFLAIIFNWLIVGYTHQQDGQGGLGTSRRRAATPGGDN